MRTGGEIQDSPTIQTPIPPVITLHTQPKIHPSSAHSDLVGSAKLNLRARSVGWPEGAWLWASVCALRSFCSYGTGGQRLLPGQLLDWETTKYSWWVREKKQETPLHTDKRKADRQTGPSKSFTFLSPSWGAGGRLLGGSEDSEPDAPSPATVFRGEGPPGRLGGPSADPLSPPSGELRWLQGPDDTWESPLRSTPLSD